MGETRYVPADDVLSRAVGDQVVLLQLSTEKYFGLSGSAAEMWNGLVEHGTVGAAEAGVVEKFDADPAVVRRDYEQFAADLAERGILRSETA